MAMAMALSDYLAVNREDDPPAAQSSLTHPRILMGHLLLSLSSTVIIVKVILTIIISIIINRCHFSIERLLTSPLKGSYFDLLTNFMIMITIVKIIIIMIRITIFLIILIMLMTGEDKNVVGRKPTLPLITMTTIIPKNVNITIVMIIIKKHHEKFQHRDNQEDDMRGRKECGADRFCAGNI